MARDEQTIWRVTAADLDALAGRELTDDELERVTRSIEHSTVMEAMGDIVFAVAGDTDNE